MADKEFELNEIEKHNIELEEEKQRLETLIDDLTPKRKVPKQVPHLDHLVPIELHRPDVEEFQRKYARFYPRDDFD